MHQKYKDKQGRAIPWERSKFRASFILFGNHKAVICGCSSAPKTVGNIGYIKTVTVNLEGSK